MSDLASQFEKTMMAHAFLECFKTAGSGVEWPELETVEKECCQLYKQYKGEEWAPVDPSLEFLVDNITAGMTVSAPAVASASDTAKHPVGALAVARGEGRSEGCGDDEAENRGDIQEAGPLTSKAAAGSVARGLVTSPRLATTPRSKGKGKGKAQEEENEDIEDHIEETFTDKHLVTLLHWRKASMVVDTGLGAGVKLEKAKGKVTVLLEKQQEYKRMQGACNNCWADNGPEGCYRWSSRSTGGKFAKRIATKVASVRNARAFVERQRELARQEEHIEVKHLSLLLPTLQEGAVVGGGGGAKVKSREVVESDGNNNDSDGDVPLAQKQAASPTLVTSAKQPQMVASEEGEGDVEMRETTPLATVAEVEQEASDMEVEGKEELETVPATAEEGKEEERAEEAKVWQRGTWSDMPLCQIGDNKLEWLGEDLSWPMPLTSAVLLVDFDKRAAGVEQRFQRELEAAREELFGVGLLHCR
ncbi:hypothetical protein J132_03331 [Termitomyces sp. J132]|nr:hypothetical protein J132_03331 [Termitomyces sp. J132]